jgi:metallo-beta-lactamase family protein
MHLVEALDKRILLDCGIRHGARHEHEADPARRSFPFEPASIDAVVLSHAHLDHCGNLPNLVRQGFAGPIYCTPATRDLLAVMLGDSARMHEEEAYVSRLLGHPETAITPPFYTREHVERMLAQCVTSSYEQAREIAPGIQLCFVNAGHLLGSAMVTLAFAGRDRTRTLTFTGDLGRLDAPLLYPPSAVPPADLLVSESTYGGRDIGSPAETAAVFADIVRRTIERDGKVLIPAFSLGRTQALVHYLQQGMRAGRMPRVPVFVDSPLSAEVAEVYRQHSECLREKMDEEGSSTSYLRSTEESKELSKRREPCVIVAPGGMCQGGRIVRHLKENLDDPRCTVVLVSYQAPGTLGRRLLEPRAKIRIHGRDWNWWAEVVELPGFSGHPDQKELRALLRPAAGQTAKVRLVHGETEQAETLAVALRAEGFLDVAVPPRGERVILD